MWYSSVIDTLQEGQSYRRTDLINLLKQDHRGLNENTYSWAIGNMLKNGILQRTGWGYYVLSKKEQKAPYVPLYSVEAQTIRFLVSNQFPQLGFTIFETTLLNEFLNHLIAKNAVYVQTERRFSNDVFDFLKWNTDRFVLYRPSAKQYSLYFRPNMIVVHDWVSEAPLNPTWLICIEDTTWFKRFKNSARIAIFQNFFGRECPAWNNPGFEQWIFGTFGEQQKIGP